MTHALRWIAASTLLLIALAAAGCGSGDEGASAATPDVATAWHAPSTILQPVIATPDPAAPDYARSQWRHWIDADHDCQDTRQEALIEESRVPVTYQSADECRVASGEWLDPYTGTVVDDPGALDLDHMVPLENAHRSGGWAWSSAEKQAYANDLDDPEHLIAVTASANRSKGSRGPEEWKPPLEGDWCRYAVDWIEIKDRWELTVTAAEWGALADMLQTCPDGGPLVIPPAPFDRSANPS